MARKLRVNQQPSEMHYIRKSRSLIAMDNSFNRQMDIMESISV
jgi:hypothetical protein